MHLIGQRWEYRIANALVYVDNAYTNSLWGQERLLVNDEQVKTSSGWFRFFQSYQEPWLTAIGEGELKVRLVSGVRSIGCKVWLDEELLEPLERYDATWSGPASSWPDDSDWEYWDQDRVRRGMRDRAL